MKPLQWIPAYISLPWSNATQFCPQVLSHLLCSLPSCFPKLLPHFVPTSTTHYSPTFLTLPPDSTHTPFPPCHPAPLTHLSRLTSSLLCHHFQLTSFLTTSRHLWYSIVLSLGKHVWLIVRQPRLEAGGWDVPLALRDLSETISKICSLVSGT